MCVLSIKVPIRKISGSLFNDPRTYLKIYDFLFSIQFLTVNFILLGYIVR